MHKIGLVLIAIVVAAVCPSKHSRAQTLDDTGLWFAAFGNGELKTSSSKRISSQPLLWWFDTHYRLRDDTDGFNQSIIRPGLGWKTNEDQAVWGGYAWILTSPIEGDEFNEHRLWQQWTANPSDGDLRFLHRSRFEQRWVEMGDDVGLRWRQMHRVQLTLSNSPQWSLIAWDEAFVNFNDTDWGAQGGFDQNRAFLGFGFKKSEKSRVRTEVGYLNQFINNQSRTDGLNHILSINLFY